MSPPPPQERRRKSRVQERLPADLEAGDLHCQCTVLNYSELGVLIQSPHLAQTGARVTVALTLPPDLPFRLEGTVVWARQPFVDNKGRRIPAVMGVTLSAPSEEYTSAVARRRGTLNPEPAGEREPRHEVYLRVQFTSGETFLTEFTENLSHGGMYIASDTVLKRGTPIRAELKLPGFAEPVQLRGKAAYCLGPDEARGRGRAPGFGVQFVNIAPQARQLLAQYIARLAVHRTTPGRRLSGQVPQEGSLRDYLVPELLLCLLESGRTGALRIERGGIVKTLYLKNGHPVFADSPLRSESLAAHLSRRGVLSLSDMNRWIAFLDKPDIEVQRALLKDEKLDRAHLMDIFVEYQEERVTNMFPWFDGSFTFHEGSDWPDGISFLPLEPHRMAFSGITRWYSSDLVSGWMGIGADSVLLRRHLPGPERALHPTAYEILNALWAGKSVTALAEESRTTVDALLPAAYALIISGYAALEAAAVETSKTVSVPLTPSPPPDSEARIEDEPAVILAEEVLEETSGVIPSEPVFEAAEEKAVEPPPKPKQEAPPCRAENPLVEKWRALIDEDHALLKNLDYFELIGVPQNAASEEIQKAYKTRKGRYLRAGVKFEDVCDKALLQKVVQIISWIETAFRTLSDPGLRRKYVAETAASRQARQDRSFELEHRLLLTLSALNDGRPDDALSIVEPLWKENPLHGGVLGLFGWALFKSDHQNINRALTLLDQALTKDPSDPFLHCCAGEVCLHLEDWTKAKFYFEQALRLQPGYKTAQEGIVRAQNQWAVSDEEFEEYIER